jgi:hypothetical protein
MEDVLDLYAAPYDPVRPVVCFDESPKQLIGEVREALPVEPGQPARQDGPDHMVPRTGQARLPSRRQTPR